jgi:hypothetical protein
MAMAMRYLADMGNTYPSPRCVPTRERPSASLLNRDGANYASRSAASFPNAKVIAAAAPTVGDARRFPPAENLLPRTPSAFTPFDSWPSSISVSSSQRER